jgi:putative oxidoreductase
LLILRFAAGLSLVAVAQMAGDLGYPASLLARWVVGGVAVLIWIGLWTPLAAVAGTTVQIIAIAFARQFNLSLVVLAAVELSLAMLGPGAWSLDARLYGRKRII